MPIEILEDILRREVTPHDRAHTLASIALFRVAQGNEGRQALNERAPAGANVDEAQLSALINWAEALLRFLENDYQGAIEYVDEARKSWSPFINLLPLGARCAVYSHRRADLERYRDSVEEARRGAVDDAGRVWLSAMTLALEGRAGEAARQFSSVGSLYQRWDFMSLKQRPTSTLYVCYQTIRPRSTGPHKARATSNDSRGAAIPGFLARRGRASGEDEGARLALPR